MSSNFIADFKFVESGVNVSGYIAEMSKERVVVEFLPSHTPIPNQCCSKVDILFMVKGILRQLNAQLVQSDGRRATLKICEPVKQTVLRKDKRHPCKAKVHFRTLQEGKPTSVWREGCSVDISRGGMCFELPYTLGMTDRGEIRINLTEVWLDTLWKKRSVGENLDFSSLALAQGEGDGKVDLSSLRFRGSVRYANPSESGVVRVGMRFLDVTATDNLRLARILLDVFE